MTKSQINRAQNNRLSRTYPLKKLFEQKPPVPEEELIEHQ
jgi:hypothetical protein